MNKSKHCIVIGNGPSKELLLERIWEEKYKKNIVSAYTIIGCNRVYSGVAAVSLDLLLAADVWCQYDVVKDKYPRKNRCKFVRWNPMPIETYSKEFIETISPGYDIVEYNPEQKEEATEWMYYATSDDNISTSAEGAIEYWKPECGYVCWIPAGYQIDNTTEFIDESCPTGAYALKEALEGGFNKIDVYGFDSIAGVYASSTQEYYDSHEEKKMGLDFIKWYDIIMKDCPEKTEVKWHTL